MLALKHVETKLEFDGSGPLKTQPMGKRKANDENFSSAENYSNGQMEWYHLNFSIAISYFLLDLGLPDVATFLAWT